MKLGSHIFPVMLYIILHSFIFYIYITISPFLSINCFSSYVSTYIYYLHKQTKHCVIVFLFFFYVCASIYLFETFQIFYKFLLVFKLDTCELFFLFCLCLSFILISLIFYINKSFVHHHSRVLTLLAFSCLFAHFRCIKTKHPLTIRVNHSRLKKS